MKKYNLSLIMKKAWELRTGKCGYTKPYAISFSECLKLAWAQAKNGCIKAVKKVIKETTSIASVAHWFLSKNLSQNEAYAVETAYSLEANRETEKAYLVKADTKYGVITFWAPKSVCSVAR